MSPPTATATRRAPARSRAAHHRARLQRRRRRSVYGVVLAVALLIAAVALMPIARRAVNEFGLPLQYQDVIRQQAAAKRLDPALIAGVIYAETKFQPSTSSAGAEGLMQLLPQTALFLARRSGATNFHVSDLATPEVNIAYGSYYLRYLLDEYHGSKIEAIAAYNGGEANVDRWVARARADGDAFQIADITFPETQAYVQRVLQAQHDYRATYPTELGYR